jgi:hypothetical protein
MGLIVPVQILRDLAESRGYFLRREALAVGIDDRWLHAGVRRGALVRLRQGAYCPAEVWAGLTAQDRYLARSLASYDLCTSEVGLSHLSALALYGCPLWGADLARVHLVHPAKVTTRAEAGVTHHSCPVPEAVEMTERDGRIVTTAARSTIDAMSLMPLESCIVAGDWMVAQGLTDVDELWRLKMQYNQHPKTRHLEVAVRMLDGRSQSVGESRARYLFWRMSLPLPILQYEIRDAAGRFVAQTDFAWPDQNVYGEFDGAIKYGRLLKEGQTPGDVVFEEKRREDAIRRVTGGSVVRWTWADLTRTSAPSAQIASLLRPAA